MLCFLSANTTPTAQGYGHLEPHPTSNPTPPHSTYTNVQSQRKIAPIWHASFHRSVAQLCHTWQPLCQQLLPLAGHPPTLLPDPRRNRRCAEEVIDFANSLLDVQRGRMSFMNDACHTSSSAAPSAGAAGGGGGWGGYVGEAEEGKCWAVAKQMLLIPPRDRDKEASETALPLFPSAFRLVCPPVHSWRDGDG